MDRRVFVGGAAVGLTGLLSGCLSQIEINGQKTRTESRTYNVDMKTRLRVHNRNGAVTVKGYDGDRMETDIEIHGPSKASVESVSVTDIQTANGLTLVTKYDNTSGQQRASVDLTIRYPNGAPVKRVRTDNGPVTITDTVGDLELKSQNGSLSARNVDGTVSLTTTNGQITAREITKVRGAKTSNGSIEIDIPAIADDVAIQTINGRIDAALGSDLDADIVASTSHNAVTLHDLELASERISQTNVTGSLGQGTHELSFETSNGPIDLRVLSR